MDCSCPKGFSWLCNVFGNKPEGRGLCGRQPLLGDSWVIALLLLILMPTSLRFCFFAFSSFHLLQNCHCLDPWVFCFCSFYSLSPVKGEESVSSWVGLSCCQSGATPHWYIIRISQCCRQKKLISEDKRQERNNRNTVIYQNVNPSHLCSQKV